MTAFWAILTLAVLFALFALLTRGRQPACGRGCACAAPRPDGACGINPERVESEHAKR